MNQAFILGAGLGNRLRPLTGRLPKPLVPLFHRPLSAWIMDACAKVGITRFAVNTHHLPEAWENFAPNADVTFFHEPVLLETGGGLKNIGSWMNDEPVLIHNGDIFSTMSLEKLVSAHQTSGNPVTLALRSEGIAKHVAIDPSEVRVTDIRNNLGISDGTHVFSGIYCVSPEFLERIPAEQKISVIPAFLELARAGKLGAIVLDEGVWLDLGDRDSYLQAHRELNLTTKIHPDAQIHPDAIVQRSVIGPRAIIESGVVVRDSVVWPGGTVRSGAILDRCIVYSGTPATGIHLNEDL